MPYYELLCLASGKLGRAELRDLLKKTCRAFMDNGATVTRLSPLDATGYGPRELAYHIRQNQQTYETGFYVNVCAFASPAALAEVNRQLRIDERVLRHLTIKKGFRDAVKPIPGVDDLPPPTSGLDPNDPEYALRKFMAEYEQEFPDGNLYQTEVVDDEAAARAKQSGTAKDASLPTAVDDVLASLKASSASPKKESVGLDWVSDLTKKSP